MVWQGALVTSSENAVMPQWVVGLRIRRITAIPQILFESRSTEIQQWAIISDTTLFVIKISNILDTNLSSPKTLGFCKGKFTRGDGGWAKKEKNKRIFGTRPKINPARAGWLKRLGLVRATLWSNFVVISVQLCSTIIAIFPFVALFLQCLLPLPDDCRLLPTPKETYDLNLSAVALIILSFRNPISIFCTKELYNPGLLPCPRLSSKLFYILKTKKVVPNIFCEGRFVFKLVHILNTKKSGTTNYCSMLNFRIVGFGKDLWDDCDASIS